MNFPPVRFLALNPAHWRSRFLLYVFIAGFALLLGAPSSCRTQHDFLQAKGESRYSRVIEIPAKNRGASSIETARRSPSARR